MTRRQTAAMVYQFAATSVIVVAVCVVAIINIVGGQHVAESVVVILIALAGLAIMGWLFRRASRNS